MIIGGRHSGKIGKLREITTVPGSVANRVILEEVGTSLKFDTIEDYVFMVGREESAVSDWGIDQ